MSNFLLSVGASGMTSQSKGMNVIGNNIANTQTNGYKAGNSSYADLIYTEGANAANGLQRQMGQGAKLGSVYYDWDPGVLEPTGVMTHIAVAGNGFLPVQLNGEVQYTRAGDFNFTETAPGSGAFVLMRPSGDVLLDPSLSPVTFDAIPTSMEIAPDGAISLVGATTASASLGLQNFANPDTLTHEGNGLYSLTLDTVLANDIVVDTPGSVGVGFLRQGELEQSNVDLIREFTEMISTQRAFQASSSTVRTADEMLQEVLQLKR